MSDKVNLEATETTEPYWCDLIGDQWEAEGVDRGRIFESSEALSFDCAPGIMLETCEHIKEGQLPDHPLDIKRICVRLLHGKNNGMEQIEMPPTRPLFAARWLRLKSTFT